MKKYFDKKTLNILHQKPILNAGIFSIPYNVQFGKNGKMNMRKIVENASDDYCLNMDQVSLNKVLYNNLDLVNFFGSEYNFLIKIVYL